MADKEKFANEIIEQYKKIIPKLPMIDMKKSRKKGKLIFK